MAQTVFHAEKSSGGSTGVGEHIDRIGRHEKPKNADPERTHLNEQLIEPRSKNLTNDINARIKEGYTKKKEIRKDAVKSVRIILSGSHDRMKEIENNPKEFKAWKEANLKFMSDRFGKENIVRMTLHRDETTPHFHCVVVPVTFDGGLSAKKMFGGPQGLAQLQTDYARAMEGFGLSRGKENSTAKHTDISEYYGRVNKQEKPFNIELPPFKTVHRFEPEKYIEEVKHTIAPLMETLETAKRVNGQFRGDNERLKKQNAELKEQAEKAYKSGQAVAEDYLKKEINYYKETANTAIESTNTKVKEAAQTVLNVVNKALIPHKLKFESIPEGSRVKIVLKEVQEVKEEKKQEIPNIRRDKGISMP
jgi:hypothetical protein